MKKLLTVLFVSVPLLLTGCNVASVKSNNSLLQNSGTTYHSYTVKNNSSNDSIDPKVAAIFEEELNLQLTKYGYKQGNDVVISYDIKAYDPGNRALRTLVGFGAGRGTMEIMTSLTDKKGNALGNVTTNAALNMGFFGGSLEKVVRQAAQESAAKIRESQIIK